MKKLLWYLNLKNYIREINGYGYKTNLFSLLVTVVIILIAILFTGIYFELKKEYIMFICIFILVLSPLTILSHYRNLHAHDKFIQLRHYLEYMIINFNINSKIFFSLKETEEFLDGEMLECVKETIHRLESYSEVNDYYEHAFSPIEEKFPNSKVKALHRLMISVETKSSSNFTDSLSNLKLNIDNWIKRTNVYEQELKAIRNNFVYAILIVLAISATFAWMYKENPQIGAFTDVFIYQIVTTLYLLSLFIIYLMSEIKFHGRWLYEDVKNKDYDRNVRYVQYIRNYNPKKGQKPLIALSVIGCGAGVIYFYYNRNIIYTLLIIILSLLLLTSHKRTYFVRKRIVKKAIEKEFPNWLSTIALLLNNRLVPTAIKDTVDDQSLIIQPYVKDLIKDIEKDPVSIAPYKNFLKEFKNDDITDAMKQLFNIQKKTSHDSKPITDLVSRNQDLLENAERLRNEDEIAAIGFSVHTTTIAFMIKTLCDLFLMIYTAINYMGGLM